MVPAAEFVHEPGDFLALNAVMAARSRLLRSFRFLVAGLFGAVACLAAALTERPGGALWPIPVAAVLGFGLGLPLAWVVERIGKRSSAKLVARVVWSAAQRDGLIVPQRVEVMAEGLRTTSDRGETLTRWPGVREVVRTNDHVFVFVTRQVAFMAPRRAFPSAEAFEAFGREAEERWRGAQAT